MKENFRGGTDVENGRKKNGISGVTSIHIETTWTRKKSSCVPNIPPPLCRLRREPKSHNHTRAQIDPQTPRPESCLTYKQEGSRKIRESPIQRLPDRGPTHPNKHSRSRQARRPTHSGHSNTKHADSSRQNIPGTDSQTHTQAEAVKSQRNTQQPGHDRTRKTSNEQGQRASRRT